MHRNTFILIFALTLLAAIVAGVNVYRFFNPFPLENATSQSPTSVLLSPKLTPTPDLGTYISNACGVLIKYPRNYELIGFDDGAMITDQGAPDTINISCTKHIPRPSLPKEKIETIRIGSISAYLYHDSSRNDGTPIDELIFTHPKNRIDVIISGLGTTFNDIIHTIKILDHPVEVLNTDSPKN